MKSANQTVRLKVSPEVARVAGKEAPRDVQLQAARGALPLPPRELVTALFFLCHGSDAGVRTEALKTLRNIDPEVLAPIAGDAGLHPKLLDFIARLRLKDVVVMAALLDNPVLPDATLLRIASHAKGPIRDLVAGRVGEMTPAEGKATEQDGDTAEETEEDDENLSKYQRALEMGVSEKIKMAMTGDKEWRGIFLKDSNKLVCAAVLKNPRITDGEILMLAKNKSSNEELIRLVTMNREWIKNSEIKKALIYHPKTPLPKALRYMSVLTEKDLKHLAKSRGVSQVLVNNARRMLTNKQKSK